MVFARPAPLDFDYVRNYLARIDDDEGRRLARLEVIIASGGEDLGG